MGVLCVMDALTHRYEERNEVEKAMTANSNQGSATIYQFPAGGRAGLVGRGDEAREVEKFAAPRVARVTSGGAWYHEEAVQSAERARKI